MKTFRNSGLAILLAAALLGVSGCSAGDMAGTGFGDSMRPGVTVSSGIAAGADDDMSGASSGDSKGTVAAAGAYGDIAEMMPEAPSEESGGFADILDSEYSADVLPGEDLSGSLGQQIQPGQLTCGVWSDFEEFAFWKSVINQNDFYSIVDCWGMKVNDRYLVTVSDEQGNPVYNAAVSLYGTDGSLIFSARTDVQGRAGLYYGYRTEGAEPARITVTDAAGVSTEITDLTTSEIAVTVGKGNAAANLELLFMVDTTGSMSDELNYLASELSDVISRVEDATKMRVATSVNFYRDTSDEYLVRSFPFGSAQEAIAHISAQNAFGGGDNPEAVHTALANAISEHQWSENTVKLCILVLDAPPHEESAVIDSLHQTISEAAKQGIRVIPVMCSSGDDSASLLCRAMALLTGGEYLFLTGDSGIGNEHHVPMVGQYSVEYLNEALIRVIADYCGTEIGIKPIRGSVQDGQNGQDGQSGPADIAE